MPTTVMMNVIMMAVGIVYCNRSMQRSAVIMVLGALLGVLLCQNAIYRGGAAQLTPQFCRL